MNKKTHYSPIWFALILVAGIWIGGLLNRSSESGSSINKFNIILQQLERIYVDSVETDNLIEKAVETLLQELDPHSSYIPSKDLNSINESMEGSFDGIGVEFNLLKDTILVVAPISGGPSQRVGILSGDKIVEVDGEVIAGTDLKNEDVFKLLKGKRGTKVTVGILRAGEDDLIDFEITRDKIPIYSLDVSYMINAEIGYIKINRFSATTNEEFQQASQELLSQGMQKLVLDLRGNPGGYLGAAINISNAFLKEDKLIVYTQGRDGEKDEYYSNKNGLLTQTEVIVMLDEGSASASEIVAGALQDNDRGTIVGRRSFGKGLVQEQFQHSDGSAYRITTSRYYTPTGRCIQRPYQNGKEDEYQDVISERFENGELLSEDSITQVDSLKFITPLGKVVYGGGGIMPDVFIPLDTTDFHNSIVKAGRKDLVRQFAYSYTNEHRSELQDQNLNDFITYFEINSSILKDFSSFSANQGVEIPLQEFNEEDIKILSTQLKALIGRNIWNDEAFFPVIHQIDDAFQKAIVL
jgi:carboxyl-terminal processing protease